MNPESETTGNDLVVIHFPGFVMKGFSDYKEWSVGGESVGFQTIRVSRERSQSPETVSLMGAKAVFFVRSHAGSPSHRELAFYDDGLPLPANLWLRLVFHDGERMECLVENSRNLILGAGFFARPADPESNNWIMYVSKPQLADIQVLGVR